MTNTSFTWGNEICRWPLKTTVSFAQKASPRRPKTAWHLRCRHDRLQQHWASPAHPHVAKPCKCFDGCQQPGAVDNGRREGTRIRVAYGLKPSSHDSLTGGRCRVTLCDIAPQNAFKLKPGRVLQGTLTCTRFHLPQVCHTTILMALYREENIGLPPLTSDGYRTDGVRHGQHNVRRCRV